MYNNNNNNNNNNYYNNNNNNYLQLWLGLDRYYEVANNLWQAGVDLGNDNIELLVLDLINTNEQNIDLSLYFGVAVDMLSTVSDLGCGRHAMTGALWTLDIATDDTVEDIMLSLIRLNEE